VTQNHQRRGILALMGGCLVFFAGACKKSTSLPATQSPADHVNLTMPESRPAASATPNFSIKTDGDPEMNRLIEKKYAADPAKAKAMMEFATKFDAQSDAELKLREFRRLTMVVPAPADFKPEPVARKIRLRLVLEKPTLHSGERPRFRLEMTNVGRETIDYQEWEASFFVKDASVLDSATMHFYLTDPKGKRTELLPKRPPNLSQATRSPGQGPFLLPDSMSTAEKEKWLKETNAMAAASANFHVKLLPGETLHSIGDDDSPKGNFRTLFVRSHFDEPGIYQLHVELDDRPLPMNKVFIEANLRTGSTLEELQKDQERQLREALGPVSSNIATVEVVR
jgi:hypothetical protein